MLFVLFDAPRRVAAFGAEAVLFGPVAERAQDLYARVGLIGCGPMRVVQLGDVGAGELGDFLGAHRGQDDVVEQPAVVAGGARLALRVDVLCEPLLGDGAHRLVGGPALVEAFLRRIPGGRDLAQDALGLTARLLRRPRRAVLAAGRPHPQPEALDLGIPEAPLSRARLRCIDGPLLRLTTGMFVFSVFRVSPTLPGKPAKGKRRNEQETGGNAYLAISSG